MPHLVDRHTDEGPLHPVAVRAVGLGPSPAEGHHRVLHPTLGAVHIDRLRIGILEGEAPVGLEGLEGGPGGDFVPQRHGLPGVEGVDLDYVVSRAVPEAGGVPDEGLGRHPGEISDVFGLVVPGERPALRGAALRGHDIGRPDDESGLFALIGLGQPAPLSGGQHLLGIL